MPKPPPVPRTTRQTSPPDIAGELAAEREARARDAAMLGEMFVRACDADAKRRMAEVAAESLAQRVATLESELRESRARGGANEVKVSQQGEARARTLQERLSATEERLRSTETKLHAAEERARSAENLAGVLEHAARASKEEASSLVARLESLEGELLSTRAVGETSAQRARVLESSISDAASRASELESLRARLAESEAALGIEKADRARDAMRLSVAEARVDELVAALQEAEDRAMRASWETEKAHADARAARQREVELEADLKRLLARVGDLERDVVEHRQAVEDAQAHAVAEGLRAAELVSLAATDLANTTREAMALAVRTIVDALDAHDVKAAKLRDHLAGVSASSAPASRVLPVPGAFAGPVPSRRPEAPTPIHTARPSRRST